MKSKLDSIVYGMVLGDGCVQHNRNRGNAYLSIYHSIRQLEYLSFKRDLLIERDIKCSSIKFHLVSAYDKTHDMCYFYTQYTPYFTEIREIFYKNNKKIITFDILNKLDDVGISLWYADDGSLSGKVSFIKNDISKPAWKVSCRIATHCFTYEEIALMVSYFKNTWGIAWNINKTGRTNKSYFELRIGKRMYEQKFRGIVAPTISQIPSMAYKVREFPCISGGME